MLQLLAGDPSAQSYWLNWKAFLCETWVLSSIVISLVLIWKNECLDRDSSGSDGGVKWRDKSWHYWFDESWRPCIKEIHPVLLMVFRLVAFVLLLAALTADVIVHGFDLFLYYTQWTFMLVTIYFLFGSLLSIYGCYWCYKPTNNFNDFILMDEENNLQMALSHTQYLQGVNTGDNLVLQRKLFVPKSMGLFGYVFQILFQITAGSVMLTDCLYWTVIFPFLSIKDYDLSFLTVVAHSLNAILLLGDITMNSLQTRWFRISYFLLWTSVYVIFQWIVHACVSTWWPYPFLDMSLRIAPLWYLVVALMHIPCYGIVVLLIKLKRSVLFKWFPESCCFL
ncbi:unnamed protein product [Cuscuta europaea]|uniref:Transmembrane protein n=1 Tax=Cuscuta europaea TaxID=41803 RepID=A0A9P0Z9C9_CUSEU|nr:unnamed protein product [Cuscuta europaea]